MRQVSPLRLGLLSEYLPVNCLTVARSKLSGSTPALLVLVNEFCPSARPLRPGRYFLVIAKLATFKINMTTALEERIGGSLDYSVVGRVFEEMRRAPVLAISRALEHREKNLAFEGLDHTGKESVIWECLNAWLEVRIQLAYGKRDTLVLRKNRMLGT
jgi:hypothetical protein